MSMRRQVLSFLLSSRISGLLAAMVLSLWMGRSHRMVPLSFSVTVLASCSYHRSFTSMPYSLQILPCMCAAALLWRWIYSVLVSSGQPENRWSMISSKRPHSLHFGSTSGFSLEDAVLVPACWEALILGCDDKAFGFYLRPAAFSHLWVLERFCFSLGPELLATLLFVLGPCFVGKGGVSLIFCCWYCRHSTFPTRISCRHGL